MCCAIKKCCTGIDTKRNLSIWFLQTNHLQILWQKIAIENIFHPIVKFMLLENWLVLINWWPKDTNKSLTDILWQKIAIENILHPIVKFMLLQNWLVLINWRPKDRMLKKCIYHSEKLQNGEWMSFKHNFRKKQIQLKILSKSFPIKIWK